MRTLLLAVVVLAFPGVARSEVHHVAALGDSISAAPGFDGVTSWPGLLAPALPAGSTVTNYAVSAKTTADLLPSFEASIRYGAFDVFAMLLGTNDLRLGTVTKENCLANLTTMWSEAAAEGKTVIAVTLLPHKNEVYAGNWTAQKQDDMEWVNAGIRAEVALRGYRIVDGYAIFGTPADPAVLNPAYTADGLHLNQPGEQRLADAVRAAVAPPLPLKDRSGATVTVRDRSGAAVAVKARD